MHHLIFLLTFGILMTTVYTNKNGNIQNSQANKVQEHNEGPKEEISSPDSKEIKRGLKRLIKLIDETKDDVISEEELTKWIYKTHRKMDMDRTEDNFKKADVNKDGTITWEEHLKKEYGYTTEDVKGLDTKKDEETAFFASSIIQDREKFQTADKDGNDVLDLNEYDALLNPAYHKHMAVIESKIILKYLDQDNDSKLTVKEMADYREDLPEKEDDWPRAVKLAQKEFVAHDLNEDGVFDFDEVVAWFLPPMEVIASDDVKELIKKADSNKDGKLSEKEILDSYDFFDANAAISQAYTENSYKLKDEL
ncbi:calumenin-A-like [Tubulanus polymorphus]|uniref:calumenin-A-like n=1 Tax=Tubulanus polymorphus TaxID=672921 RepID=UPI003DA5DA41